MHLYQCRIEYLSFTSMNIKNVIAAMVFGMLSLATSQSVKAQDESTRLLPASFAKAIKIEWRQDGEAVDIDVTNPKDKWVLQELEIEIRYPSKPEPKIAQPTKKPKKSNNASSVLDFEAGERFLYFLPEQYTKLIKLNALAGQISQVNIEARKGEKIAEIVIISARGRSHTMLEKLKAKIL